MKLQVVGIHWSDVYKDIARVPREFRRDISGAEIPEGTICKVTLGHRATYLSVRGQSEHGNPAIHLDERTRKILGVNEGEFVAVSFRPAWYLGQFMWAWSAADPAYRIATRLGVISVLLGVIGFVLGVVSFFK